MKVKIEYVVDVPDDIRREINAHYGKPGLASRKEVKDWYWHFGLSMDDDLGWAATNRTEQQRGVTCHE